MKLWHLFRTDDIGYDEYEEKIISAKTEKRAREIANEQVGDEGKIWDGETVKCELVKATEEGVYMSSFRSG